MRFSVDLFQACAVHLKLNMLRVLCVLRSESWVSLLDLALRLELATELQEGLYVSYSGSMGLWHDLQFHTS